MANRKTRAQRPEDVKINLRGNPEAPTYAPNQIRILMSTLDFTLILSEMRLQPDGIPVMTEAARVYLSPQHAKALAALLTSKLYEYEDAVGAITLPGVEFEAELTDQSIEPETTES